MVKITESPLEDILRIYNDSKNDISLMDSIIYYCERNNLEVESIIPVIKSNLKIKSSLRIEAENLNYLPKKSRLPI